MQAKMETAAEKYRRIKQDRLAKSETETFVSPSGMEWQLRRPDIAQFVMNGTMPMSFAAKIAKVAKETADPAEAFSNLDFEDKIKTLDFSQKIVRYCAVSPRIVETPSGPDEIGYDEVEMDDFNAILAWAMPGGDGAASLDNFRR